MELWKNKIQNKIVALLRFYLPYLFTTSLTHSRRYFIPESPLYDEMCEENSSEKTYTSSLFKSSSTDFAFGVKRMFEEGMNLLYNLLFYLMDITEKDTYDLVFGIIREFLNNREVLGSVKGNVEEEIQVEIRILYWTCVIVQIYCHRAFEELKYNKASEIKNPLIINGNMSLLHRLFSYFNPHLIIPSQKEEEECNDIEDIMRILALCVLRLFFKEVYNDGNEDYGIFISFAYRFMISSPLYGPESENFFAKQYKELLMGNKNLLKLRLNYEMRQILCVGKEYV